MVADERRPPAIARLEPGRDVGNIAGVPVPFAHPAAQSRTVDNGRIGRIGNVVVAFVSAHRMPVTEGDRAVVAAACDGYGAGILLAGIDPVGEAVVGGQMIELPGRLVVP